MFKDLKEQSKKFRLELLDLVKKHKKGHIPSAFSMMEMVIYLHYSGIMKDNDKLIVSKGHAAFGLYPILADKGLINKKEFEKFTKPDGLLKLYADNSIPGIEIPAGSLGHGIGIGCLLYTSPSPRDRQKSRMPSSA
jgi:transketolase